MKNHKQALTAVLLLFLGCFFGCGGDDVSDPNDGSIADAPLDTYSIPTITIQKIPNENLLSSWRLSAQPAPKTDLAVLMLINERSLWVIIPKSDNHSQTFNHTGWITIEKLPMVSIVGTGLVVNLEKLQRALPVESIGGHRIPKDYDFPLYNVGEPSQIVGDFLQAHPATGSRIAANSAITITFNGNPGDVTASAGHVSGGGKIRFISGPFKPGALRLRISWENEGSHTLTYTVIPPDTTPPTVIGGTVKDGDRDVNPEVLNGNGIEITFSEAVRGNIALQTEGGDDVGWIGKVESNKGTLELVKGKEIGNQTTYVITGRIEDAARNEAEVSITFTTIGKK